MGVGGVAFLENGTVSFSVKRVSFVIHYSSVSAEREWISMEWVVVKKGWQNVHSIAHLLQLFQSRLALAYGLF